MDLAMVDEWMQGSRLQHSYVFFNCGSWLCLFCLLGNKTSNAFRSDARVSIRLDIVDVLHICHQWPSKRASLSFGFVGFQLSNG